MNLKQYLDDLVERCELPSYCLSVSRGGEDFVLFGGNRDEGTDVAPNHDTQYAVYSVSKAVTAMSALRLIAAGVLTWDTPVADILPGWSDPLIDGVRWDVRLSHLLSHTAGFTYGSRAGSVAEAYRNAGFLRSAPSDLEGRAMYARFSRLPRLYAPSTGWSYSLASDVLGWVLSEVRGKSLGEVVCETVLRPLSMSRSGMCSEIQPTGNFAVVCERTSGVWRRSHQAMALWDGPGRVDSGGASLVTTQHDLHSFSRALATQDHNFLPKPLWDAVGFNMIPAGRYLDSGVQSPLLGRTVDGVGYSTGVAVVVDESRDLCGAAGEIGWEGSTGCFFLANARHNLAIAFLTNVYPGVPFPRWKRIRQGVYDFIAKHPADSSAFGGSR